MPAERIVQHGLIQKAKLDAEKLRETLVINTAGQIWRKDDSGPGWYRAGDLPFHADREDFLVAQLGQEDR